MNEQPTPWGIRQGLSYGLLGLPLAFVALPLYVVLPNYYANQFGMPLATLGTVLLMARLFDAFTDPVLGRWSDQIFGRSIHAVLGWGALSAVILAIGLAALFMPAISDPRSQPRALMVWALACLIVTYTAYSQLSISHQSWGARLGGNDVYRSRVVASREGAALIGVVLASILPSLAGIPAMLAVFTVALAIAWYAWTYAPRPTTAKLLATPATSLIELAPPSSRWLPMLQPWRKASFRRLVAVFMLNGIASAIPATLVLFFIQDVLQAPRQQEPLFLLTYFVFAACSIPVWLKLVSRRGLGQTWLIGMLLAVTVFAWTVTLGAGDSTAFFIVCAMSGMALGADLAIPSALLAGLIAQEGDAGSHEGAYFGWWNFATKLNLALAAGLTLPALQWLGYLPGSRTETGLQMLSIAYAVVPCVLKLAAAAALYRWVIRHQR
jgi:GPH family glycoside/pentoside/hexuronide:cation symporter